jgi:hypothetical protein
MNYIFIARKALRKFAKNYGGRSKTTVMGSNIKTISPPSLSSGSQKFPSKMKKPSSTQA